MNNDEIYRLINGDNLDDNTNSNMLTTFIVKCDGNSFKILSKCKEVLKIVLEHNENLQLPLDEWRKLLPEWFIKKCSKELTKEEIDEYIKLPIEERDKIAEGSGWCLSDWLYWFEPDQREWYWWSSKIVDNTTIKLVVAVEGWPFPWGALEWLCIACGAIDIEEQ